MKNNSHENMHKKTIFYEITSSKIFEQCTYFSIVYMWNMAQLFVKKSYYIQTNIYVFMFVVLKVLEVCPSL